VFLSLSLQSASGGKITSLKGGVPIVIDGQVVGAVGVGGGTGEQDVEVAKAGIQALLDELGKKK
jgi:glc operon protein GlcG